MAAGQLGSEQVACTYRRHAPVGHLLPKTGIVEAASAARAHRSCARKASMLVLVLAASGPASDTNLGHAYLRAVETWGSRRSTSCHSWLLDNAASG